MDNPDFSKLTCLVWDNGLFTNIAFALARNFGRVLYGTPYVNAFPKSNATLPGDGFDEIERVIDFWPAANAAELIVFPDVMFADVQEQCESQGMRVFGSRWGERLELDRWWTKSLLRELEMPVAESHRIRGMKALREFLQAHDDFWVKTSRYRGDFETFHAKTYDHVKPKLDELEWALGMKGEIYLFLVEKNIPAVAEIGYDGYTVDGQFPRTTAFGYEAKDVCYVGAIRDYDQLPEALRWVNAKLAPWLKQERYRGFFSTEVRVGEDGKFYLTDPTCRAGSPPSEAYVEWFENWHEIAWHGAAGDLVEPRARAKYAVEVMLHSSWADKNWQPVVYPDAVKRWVYLRNACKINGVVSAVPQSYGLPEIGAVSGLGDTILEAVQAACDHARQVEGYYIQARVDGLSATLREIEKAQGKGVPFTGDAFPSAAEVEEAVNG